ncbi:zinc transporter ZntB [Ferrimonas gelatinilytica]|uniref:Zinc transporter ZntB n=1 Tax=Ferrimonas gelatinilytica TaxID=1255257 RepID=A0ABP9RVG5_9GAMM
MSLFHHCLLLDGLGGARPTHSAAPPAGGLTWLHLDYRHQDAREWLSQQEDLPQWVRHALQDEDTRPRIQEDSQGVLICLRGLNFNGGQPVEDMVAIRLWITKHRVISSQSRALKSVDDLVERLAQGKGPHTSAELVIALTRSLILRMSDTLDTLEETVSSMEAQMLDDLVLDTRVPLTELRRQVITLKRYLGPQREALAHLEELEVDLFSPAQQHYLRELGARLSAHLDLLSEVRERATVVNEENLSRTTDRMDQRMYLLSLIAAVFLPLGFLTGLFGVNIAGMPGTDSPMAFWWFVASMTLIGVVVTVAFRLKRWL